jgi:hypothetical protein
VVQAPPHGVSSGQGAWTPGGDGWAPATHVDVAQRPTMSARAEAAIAGAGIRRRSAARERGLAGWAALLVLLAISGLGGLIDLLNGSSLKSGFNISLVIASAVAILIVRRSAMFPIVIAPPIVYAVASAVVLYAHLHGAKNRRSLLIDAAANWLVYGFPAIAGATAVVLIVAGIRMVIRR